MARPNNKSKHMRDIASSMEATEPLSRYGMRLNRPFASYSLAKLLPVQRQLRVALGKSLLSDEDHVLYKPGATLVRGTEVNNSPQLSNLPKKEVYDYMAQLAVSSPRMVRARPAGIERLGAPDSKIKSLVVTFDDEATEVIQDDRACALDILDQMVSRERYPQVEWLDSTPCYRLAGYYNDADVKTKLPSDRAIIASLPSELCFSMIVATPTKFHTK